MAAEPEKLTLQMLKTIRREQEEHRPLLLGVIDQGRRLERRMSEMRDDLELAITCLDCFALAKKATLGTSSVSIQ